MAWTCGESVEEAWGRAPDGLAWPQAPGQGLLWWPAPGVMLHDKKKPPQ